MINAGTVAAYLTLDTSDFTRGIETAGETLTRFADTQSGKMSGLGAVLGGFGKTLLGKLEGMAGSIGRSAAIAGLPAVLRAKGILAMEGLVGGMLSQGGAAGTSMGNLMGQVKRAAGGVSFVSVGQNIMGGILSGMNGRKASLFATARSIASGVSGVIRSALKINSPSRVMMEIGEFTAQGMELGLRRGAEGLYETASMVSRETAEVLAGVSFRGGSTYETYRWQQNDDRMGGLIDAIEKLAASQSTVEIDGRPFGRLVREYV